jgi:site-specific DNA-methyltransferase (adenine-specific)
MKEGTETMETYKTDLLDLRRMDCMELLKATPDKAFDLSIIDPPYGLGEKLVAGGTWSVKYQKKGASWDTAPSREYFEELFRVSKNWIIWGGNYFSDKIPPARNFIVWYKPNMAGMHTMSNMELALTSFDRNSKLFTKTSQTEKANNRFHVCQKPVALYRWLLSNYAKQGDKILDTHLGSMSIAIACHYAGYHLTGTELDADYFREGVERVKRETAQMTLL